MTPENKTIKHRSIPLVLLLGRPNVGKSTLYNAILGHRSAIEFAQAGTTRDIRETIISQDDQHLMLIDSAGMIDPETTQDGRYSHENRLKMMSSRRLEETLENSAGVIIVVDAQEGLHPRDEFLVKKVRRLGKPAILVVNKVDNAKNQMDAQEFLQLGISETYFVSAIHRHGLQSIKESIWQFSKKGSLPSRTQEISVAIVGRPNVGKSSLINRLCGKERALVDDIPGTTRDPTDTWIEKENQIFCLVDTAGLKKKKARLEQLDSMARMMAIRALQRADIAVLVIDALEGITAGDTTVAGEINSSEKAVMILVNKWDVVTEKREELLRSLHSEFEEKIPFLAWAPVMLASAKTGENLHKIWPALIKINQNLRKPLPETQELKEILKEATRRHPPKWRKKQLKITDAVWKSAAPPKALIQVNNLSALHFSYKRYLDKFIRSRWDLTGVPIVLEFTERIGK